MIFSELVKYNTSQFLEKVKEISSKLKTEPDYLMAVMYKESRLNHQAQNPNGGATGLIQFMPKTASGLGTSTAQLLSMSNVEQLDYVYKYYKPYVGKLNSYPDLYLATFFPAALGKPNNYILEGEYLSRETIAAANPGIDLDKSGYITIGEFKEYTYKGLPEKYQSILKKKTMMKNLEIIVLVLTFISVSVSLYLKLK
jgi:hypothetical protein